MKIALVLALLLALAVAALIAAITQPVLRSGPRWRGAASDPERLSRLVHGLVALGPRHDAKGQSRALEFIRAQLGNVPAQEQRYEAAGATFRNLILPQIGRAHV